jgi:hypothetical protein
MKIWRRRRMNRNEIEEKWGGKEMKNRNEE